MTTPLDGVVLRTQDGTELAADVYHPCRPPRGGVVVVHGFSATRRLVPVVEQARALADSGYLVLAYDARGHGTSGGDCTLGRLEAYDVAAAVGHLRAEVPAVVTVGASMGAAAVLAHAVEHPGLVGIVLVSMATSWRSVLTPRGMAATFLTRTQLGRTYTRRRTGIRVASQWETGEPPTAQVRRIHVPVAIVHGQQDRMIRPSAAMDLYAAASEPRRLELVPGMGHSFQSAAVPAVTRAVDWVFDQVGVRGPQP